MFTRIDTVSDLADFLQQQAVYPYPDSHFQSDFILTTLVDMDEWKTSFEKQCMLTNHFIYDYLTEGWCISPEKWDLENLNNNNAAKDRAIYFMDFFFQKLLKKSMSKGFFGAYKYLTKSNSHLPGPYMRTYFVFLRMGESVTLRLLVNRLLSYSNMRVQYAKFGKLYSVMSKMTEKYPVTGPTAIIVALELTPRVRSAVLEKFGDSSTVSTEEILDFLKQNYRID